jgi:hypothetical protein
MTAVVEIMRFGPATYDVSASATAGNAIDGGLLVEFDGTTGTVKQAVVDSAKWLGVALYPAKPVNSTVGSPTSEGYDVLVIDDIPKEVAVAWTGVFKLLATNAVLAQGDIVYCGANGKIQKATVTGRPVGIVVEPGGIAANGRGAVRLF